MQQEHSAFLKRQIFHPTSEPLNQIPNVPGVYFFYHYQKKHPVYIGKSLNLRARLQSHYQAAKTQNKAFKITHFAQKIGYIETAGELGALLLEAMMIKAFMPCFNKRLIRIKSHVTMILNKQQQFFKPTFTRFDPSTKTIWHSCYGLYKSRHHAISALEKICAQEKLCLKMLGLENTSNKSNRPCFAYELNRCQGACVGLVSAEEHNQILKHQLEKMQLLSWPFKTPIQIKERREGMEDIHLIDNWRYINTQSHDFKANAKKKTLVYDFSIQKNFDKDIYHILYPIIRTNGGNINENIYTYKPTCHD